MSVNIDLHLGVERMVTGSAADGVRVSMLGRLHDQLLSILDQSDSLEEDLLSAQLALALDTVRAALARAGGVVQDPLGVGASAE